MMFLMLILMVTAAVTLFTLGITRAAHRDWRRSLVCLATGAILFILFGHQARQYRTEVKTRAKEYAQTHPRSSEQGDGTETRRPSNNQIQNIGTDAPNSDL